VPDNTDVLPQRQRPLQELKFLLRAFLFYGLEFLIPMNLDELCTLDDRIEGEIVSVRSLPDGNQSFIVRDREGFSLGRGHRWVGNSKELVEARRVRQGMKVKFLAGTPRKKNVLPRCHQVEIIQSLTEVSNESGKAAATGKAECLCPERS